MNKRIQKKLDKRRGFYHYRDFKKYVDDISAVSKDASKKLMNSDMDELRAISKELKELSDSLDIPIIACRQKTPMEPIAAMTCHALTNHFELVDRGVLKINVVKRRNLESAVNHDQNAGSEE